MNEINFSRFQFSIISIKKNNMKREISWEIIHGCKILYCLSSFIVSRFNRNHFNGFYCMQNDKIFFLSSCLSTAEPVYLRIKSQHLQGDHYEWNLNRKSFLPFHHSFHSIYLFLSTLNVTRISSLRDRFYFQVLK